MKKNMGTTDRVIRVIIAVLFFTNILTGTLGLILMALAGIFILTSMAGFCPLYAPFGFSTCSTRKNTKIT